MLFWSIYAQRAVLSYYINHLAPTNKSKCVLHKLSEISTFNCYFLGEFALGDESCFKSIWWVNLFKPCILSKIPFDGDNLYHINILPRC